MVVAEQKQILNDKFSVLIQRREIGFSIRREHRVVGKGRGGILKQRNIKCQGSENKPMRSALVENEK